MYFKIPIFIGLFAATGLFSQNKYAKIEWEPNARSVEYILQIAEDENFFHIIYEEITTKTVVKYPVKDIKTENIYARIAGIGQNGVRGDFSKPFKIGIMGIDSPVEMQDVSHKNAAYVPSGTSFILDTYNENSFVQTYVRINKEDWIKYTNPVLLTKEGLNTIQYFSVDQSGNRERVQTVKYILDTQPPAISIDFINISKHNGNYYTGKKSYFKINATDKLSGLENMECSFSENRFLANKYRKCSSGILQIPDGFKNKTFYLHVRAKDKMGNVSENENILFHDLRPPEITVGIPYGKKYFKLGSEICVSAQDKDSGVKWIKYSIDESSPEYYEDSIVLSEKGEIKLRIYAEDFSGNLSVAKIPLIVLGRKDYKIIIKSVSGN